MKRTLIAAVLLILCTGICTAGYSAVEKKLTQTAGLIRQAEESSDISEVKKITDKWQSDKKLLSSLLKHQDIDEFDEYCAEIAYLAEHDRDECFAVLKKFEIFIEGIIESEKPHIGNVF